MKPEAEKQDLRSRRTRKLLQTALVELLQGNDLEAISVKDICDRAMIHRTTFYKHYVDKYDLLNRGAEEMFEELSRGIPTPEEAVAAYASTAPPEHYVRVFEHAAKNRAFYTMMLAPRGGYAFRRLFENYLVEQARVRIGVLVRDRQRTPPVPVDMLAYYSAGAAVKVLAWWLEQKNPPSPVEMARYIARLLSNGMVAMLGIEGS